MRRIQESIGHLEKVLQTLMAEKDKLTAGVNKQRLAAMKNFVRPSFSNRQERAAVDVLLSYEKKIKDAEKDLMKKRALYQRYAEIAAKMRGTGLRADTLDKMCRTAVTEGDCVDMRGDTNGETCTIYDIDPVNNWSARDMTDNDSVFSETFGSADPNMDKKLKKARSQRLVSEADSHGGISGTTQCRHPGPSGRASPAGPRPACKKSFPGLRGGETFISPANLQRLSALNTALLNSAYFISPEAKIAENREAINTVTRLGEEFTENVLALLTFMNTADSKKPTQEYFKTLFGGSIANQITLLTTKTYCSSF